MKPPLARYLIAVLFCAFATFSRADDFKSMVIAGGGPAVPLPRIHDDQFMVIRNFTQEDGGSSTRGVVMVSTDGGITSVGVLSAAILKTSMATPEVINNVVIAGPADVSVTCGNTSGHCFISYKKDSN
jgi:hypothetical protein